MALPVWTLLLFLFFSCGETKPTPGSGVLPPPPAPGGSAPITIFPHTKDWKNPEVHGGWVNQNGRQACLKCHNSAPAEGLSAGGPPPCQSCHSLYPHPENWVKQEIHGAHVIAEGKGNCATQCHGTDLSGGLSKISCNLCHTIYPHSKTWRGFGEHGEIAKGNGKINCKACHGADFGGGQSGVSCYRCHEVYPHAEEWVRPEGHGEYVQAKGKESCASECHGNNLEGGVSGLACNSCHEAYPHQENWPTFEGHGQYVKTTLRGATLTCQACHGTDLKGGISQVSCNSCHRPYPHPTGWREGSVHGAMAYGEGKLGCASGNCHGNDFRGSTHAPSCSSCHADFPHTNPKWMVLEPSTHATGRSNDFHGDNLIRKMRAGNAAVCTMCHGTDFNKPVGQERTCLTCHPGGITHQNNGDMVWRESGHGAFFTGRGYTSVETTARCWQCHGNPEPEFNLTQTRASLAGQSDCYSCHWSYPHIAFNEGFGTNPWEPVETSVCGTRHPGNFGHFSYIFTPGPLLLDQNNRTPTTPESWTSAVDRTCGGTGGGCHTDGNRTYNTLDARETVQCNYCHNATRPVQPPLPDCDGPPPVSLQKGEPPIATPDSPLPNAVNISIEAGVAFHFNEAMARESVLQAGAVLLKASGGADAVAITVSCSEDWCRTATLRPQANLVPGTIYEMRITTAVRDYGGTNMASDVVWSFETEPPDLTPPSIVSTTPANGAVDVPVGREIYIRFNERLDSTSVPGNVTVHNLTQGSAVTGSSGCFGTECTSVRFRARRLMSYGTHYQVTVSGTIKDRFGNRLGSSTTFTFTTMAEPPPDEEW